MKSSLRNFKCENNGTTLAFIPQTTSGFPLHRNDKISESNQLDENDEMIRMLLKNQRGLALFLVLWKSIDMIC